MKDHTAELSQLGYALLGLIAMKPSTGYELRKIFETTPMGSYSSSPGAIYPALRKLQAAKVVRTREIVGKTARTAQQMSITPSGQRTLETWLRRLPMSDDVERDMNAILLRFSYLDILNDLDFSIQFVEHLETILIDRLRFVREIQQGILRNGPVHGRLALACGVDVLEAHLEWSRISLRQLSRMREAK